MFHDDDNDIDKWQQRRNISKQSNCVFVAVVFLCSPSPTTLCMCVFYVVHALVADLNAHVPYTSTNTMLASTPTVWHSNILMLPLVGGYVSPDSSHMKLPWTRMQSDLCCRRFEQLGTVYIWCMQNGCFHFVLMNDRINIASFTNVCIYVL